MLLQGYVVAGYPGMENFEGPVIFPGRELDAPKTGQYKRRRIHFCYWPASGRSLSLFLRCQRRLSFVFKALARSFLDPFSLLTPKSFAMRTGTIAALAGNLALTSASILWDGRFNDLESAEDLLKWSWSNQVGPYQYYIHGNSDISAYVELSEDYKNPADTGSEQGVKITLDDTAYWNGQNMRRTELIPQTSAPINEGKVWYHFSIMRKGTNAPATTREHQIAFFESHFTELKAGWLSGASGTSDPLIRWCISGTTHWSVNWAADVWHNVAYEIDFDAGTVGFWHSTGRADLELVVEPIRASTSSNGADWHLGVLELPRGGYADGDEDIYFSGVYVEDGEITTFVSGPGGTTQALALQKSRPVRKLIVSF